MTESEDDQDDEAGSTCTICMDQWTIGSDHRICALKCGHLFGRSCIERWIKDKAAGAKCPTCQKPARKADIRDLWCKTVKAADDSELKRTKEALEHEKKLRKDEAANLFHSKMKLQLALDQVVKLTKELYERDEQIQRLTKLIQEGGVVPLDSLTDTTTNGCTVMMTDGSLTPRGAPLATIAPMHNLGRYHMRLNLETSPIGGCRFMAISKQAQQCIIAQPNQSQVSMFGKFGLKKFSLVDTNAHEFIPLHTKQITSFQLKTTNDTALTCSQDRKIKITPLQSNMCVQSYDVQCDPWCVSWSTRQSFQFYVGLNNRTVAVFDMRNTNQKLYETKPFASTRPVSMSFVNGLNDDIHGLVVSDNTSCHFLESRDSLLSSDWDPDRQIDPEFELLKPHVMPFSGRMGTVDFNSRYEKALISTRPGSSCPKITHNLVSFDKKFEAPSSEDISQDETMDRDNYLIETKPVRTFQAGNLSSFLTQSRILSHPSGQGSMVGCGDEETRGFLLWNASDGRLIQNVQTPCTVRDLYISNDPEDVSDLYCLHDKGLAIYSWQLV